MHLLPKPTFLAIIATILGFTFFLLPRDYLPTQSTGAVLLAADKTDLTRFQILVKSARREFAAHLHSRSPDSTESGYYRITTLPTPRGAALEVSSIELLPDSRLAIGTRRGEVWLVDNAQRSQSGRWNDAFDAFDSPPPAAPEDLIRYQRFAEGQHEILGLAEKEGWLYTTTRYEILRMQADQGSKTANRFEIICNQWGISGDYHEYTFGSRFDKNNELWVACCLTGSTTSAAPFRGWALRIQMDGTMIPTCSGIRSPGGIGLDAEGDAYYTDNQGHWRGSCTLQHLVPGSFQGHPGGNEWYKLAPLLGVRPPAPIDNGRMVAECERNSRLVPPTVYMVHGPDKIGMSSTAIVCDQSEGRFGPFAKQLFIPDYALSNISRVYLETVNGVRQGCVIPFLKGLKSGPIAARMGADGQFFVGGSDRGWGAKGGYSFALERVEWTGKTPFEIHEIHAKPDGFELTFTQPVKASRAIDPDSYSIREFTYIYHSQYGSPEVDEVRPSIQKIVISKGGFSVRLTLSQLTKGHIHEIRLPGIRSTQGTRLLHPLAYYTLNEIPKGAN